MFYVRRGTREIDELPTEQLKRHPEKPAIWIYTNRKGKEFELLAEDLFTTRTDAAESLGVAYRRGRKNHVWDFGRLEIGERMEIPPELRDKAANAARLYKFRLKRHHGIPWEFKILQLSDATLWLERLK